jgi:hypothetical protein
MMNSRDLHHPWRLYPGALNSPPRIWGNSGAIARGAEEGGAGCGEHGHDD